MFLRKIKRQQGSNHGCLCSYSGLSEFWEKRQGYKFARKKEVNLIKLQAIIRPRYYSKVQKATWFDPTWFF